MRYNYYPQKADILGQVPYVFIAFKTKGCEEGKFIQWTIVSLL